MTNHKYHKNLTDLAIEERLALLLKSGDKRFVFRVPMAKMQFMISIHPDDFAKPNKVYKKFKQRFVIIEQPFVDARDYEAIKQRVEELGKILDRPNNK